MMGSPATSKTDLSYEALREKSRPFELTAVRGRYRPLDATRGLAIFLMIVSHTVMALMSKSLIPDYGIVPIHLLTKFSSSLFFIVFGLGLRLFYLHHCGTDRWSEKRNKLMGKGLEIFVWYKILTFVQLYGTRSPREVFDHLIFREFPDFVEVLSFYSIALIWVPLLLPVWKRLPLSLLLKPALVVGMFVAGNWLHFNFDFGDWDAVKTLLVEYDGRYTFGQFQRGSFVLFGLLLGDIMVHLRNRYKTERYFGLVLLGFSALFAAAFYWVSGQDFMAAFDRIASNVGKHPPNLEFLTFSVGGALAIFSVIHILTRAFSGLARTLFWPWTTIGRRALLVFNFHILFIFLVLRNGFDWRNQLNYPEVLSCVAMVFILAIVLVKCVDFFSSRTEWEQ